MQGCVICDRQQGRDTEPTVVYADEFWTVRHSAETDILGYLLIEARRHFLDLSEATPAEVASYGQVLAEAMAAIRSTTDCARVYTFSLGEAVPHFHVHVIPRTGYLPPAYRGRGVTSYPTWKQCDRNLMLAACERLRRRFRTSAITSAPG